MNTNPRLSRNTKWYAIWSDYTGAWWGGKEGSGSGLYYGPKFHSLERAKLAADNLAKSHFHSKHLVRVFEFDYTLVMVPEIQAYVTR